MSALTESIKFHIEIKFHYKSNLFPMNQKGYPPGTVWSMAKAIEKALFEIGSNCQPFIVCNITLPAGCDTCCLGHLFRDLRKSKKYNL